MFSLNASLEFSSHLRLDSYKKVFESKETSVASHK